MLPDLFHQSQTIMADGSRTETRAVPVCHSLVHGGRRDLSRWAGDEENPELLWVLSEMAVELFSLADVCEHTRDLGGHGCGCKTGGVDTGGWSSRQCWNGSGWCCESGCT